MGATAVIVMGGGYFATSMAEALLPFIAAPHAMIGGLEAGAGVEIGTHGAVGRRALPGRGHAGHHPRRGRRQRLSSPAF